MRRSLGLWAICCLACEPAAIRGHIETEDDTDAGIVGPDAADASDGSVPLFDGGVRDAGPQSPLLPACPPSSTVPTLPELTARFESTIYPLMTRSGNGCVACHDSASRRPLSMAENGTQTFLALRSSGFLGRQTGMMPERVYSNTMPPGPGKWTDSEKTALLTLACDLEALDRSAPPPDEVFPDNLRTPWTGTISAEYDNTFLAFPQLRNRVQQVFDDDWVREGSDRFSENIALFGGVDFVNTFVAARQATPEYFVALDLLTEDVCGRAASNATGPFTGLDLERPIRDEPASRLLTFEAEASTITGEPDGCLPGPGATEILLCTSGQVSSEINLPIEGDYTIRTRVRGDPNPAGSPLVVIAVDGVEALSAEVPETTLVERSVRTRLSAGSHVLSIAFPNDDVTDGDDRNLFVDRFSIEGPHPGTTNGSPTGRANALDNLAVVLERILTRRPRRAPVDEIVPLYDLLLSLAAFDGNQRGAYAGVCQGLVRHPDFLFTRPPSSDAETDRERALLVKSSLDLLARLPTVQEFQRFESGVTRAQLVDDWLETDEARDYYYQRIRQIIESDGTPDGDEPARLWSYVMTHDRPIQEVLTADYTVGPNFERVERPAEHGATGVLTMKGYIRGKPGLPHYNYAARVLTGFMGFVFEVPQEALDARALATAASTVDPTSICYSCHKLLTPLAHQRLRWDDDGNYRTTFPDGQTIDDSDRGLVESYPYAGSGLESFSRVAVRKEGFIRRMANVHFQMAFGRNLRHTEDERDVYLDLWNAADSGRGTFKDLIRTIQSSRAYSRAWEIAP